VRESERAREMTDQASCYVRAARTMAGAAKGGGLRMLKLTEIGEIGETEQV